MHSRPAASRRGEGLASSSPWNPDLPWLDEDVGAAVLGPARFRVLGALRALFTVADDRNAVGLHGLRHEVVHRGFRAPLADRQAVVVGDACVSVALAEHEAIGVRLER